MAEILQNTAYEVAIQNSDVAQFPYAIKASEKTRS